ncbi:transcription termination/antitermination NusG family protein [Bradyrhizobium sp. USDA 4545]|uniref:transcription termination/antitermination NusG family protein n=1 Tax=Bradyrhizobium sp. USDA 4545 TaxID=2817705 RepID=UPI0020A5CB62|nr:transcription termination/antitermination NusG family protein [Bradyrhizobium sp. USDA 4545]MCP1832816.1 transcriptional antiterminator NusG [Bradyrhizobium sp. USDA 4545]
MKPWLEELSPEVRAELARPVQAFDPRDADVDGPVARWYVVSVFSRDAERELARRRFGIYVPAYLETIISRGRKSELWVPIMPGYVFVLLWETDANYQRLARTAGVDKVLGWIKDVEIHKLRYHESCEQLDEQQREAMRERLLRRVQRKRVGSRRKKHSRKAVRTGKVTA